jgi:hypothetical protein
MKDLFKKKEIWLPAEIRLNKDSLNQTGGILIVTGIIKDRTVTDIIADLYPTVLVLA